MPSRNHLFRLSSCIAAFLLSCCAAGSVFAAEQPAAPEQPVEPEQPAAPEQPAEPEQPAKPEQPAEPTPAADVIALELREVGESQHAIEFVVPLDGRIAGWTELYGEPHFCRLEADQIADARISLRMRCGTSRQLEHVNFDFKVVRELELGTPILLGEFTPSDGERVEVVATRS